MERTTESTSGKFSIKVDSKELERIIQARKNLDDVKALAVYAAQYQNLGWSPVALEAQNGADLEVDFDQPQTNWLWLLMDLALQEVRVGLAIRPGPQSRLFVLRVKPALARSLDRLGNWRSPCIARLGNAWEHHFLVLPPSWDFPPEQVIIDKEAPLSVLRRGTLVPVPPSSVPSGQMTWEWLTPPWDHPPGEPSPELLILLEDCGYVSRKTQAAVADLPSWKEIYPCISHSERLLQALLAPEEESGLYYRKILYEAMQAGFQDLDLLLGLLWHAPHSEIRFDPEGREQLAQWAEALQELLSPESSGQTTAAEELDDEAASSSPEEVMAELQALAAQTLELEQQLEQLEDLRASQEMGPEDKPAPASEAKAGSQDNQEELAKLRQAVEDFVAGMKDLSDSE
jgi:hypothetical protein